MEFNNIAFNTVRKTLSKYNINTEDTTGGQKITEGFASTCSENDYGSEIALLEYMADAGWISNDVYENIIASKKSSTSASNKDKDNVKKVLFGYQKQANVINDAVCEDITNWLMQIKGSDCCYSEKSVVKVITEVLEDACQPGPIVNETLIKYVAGTESLKALLESDDGCNVFVSQPNPESPKHLFRLAPTADKVNVEKQSSTSTEYSYSYTKEETIKERVDRLIKEYSPKCTDPTLTKNKERALYAMYTEYGGKRGGRDKGLSAESQLNWIIVELKDTCPAYAAKELNDDVKASIYALSFMF